MRGEPQSEERHGPDQGHDHPRSDGGTPESRTTEDTEPLPLRWSACWSGRHAACFSAALRVAERDLLFTAISASDGLIGFRVRTRNSAVLPQPHTGRSGGHVQPVAPSASLLLTIRSSSE